MLEKNLHKWGLCRDMSSHLLYSVKNKIIIIKKHSRMGFALNANRKTSESRRREYIQWNSFYLHFTTDAIFLRFNHDHSNLVHFRIINFCLLLTDRCLWKNDFVNFDFNWTNRFSDAFSKAYSTYISRNSLARRISTFYNVNGRIKN